MGAILITLSVFLFIGAIALMVMRKQHNRKLNAKVAITERDEGTEISEDRKAKFMENNAFFAPAKSSLIISLLGVTLLLTGLFNNVYFYAEPGYIYHVRTIMGEERVVDDVGYSYYLFGRINTWKKAMTVQSVPFADNDGDGRPDLVSSEAENSANTSASLPPLSVVMLDQVDSRISATTRFRIPADPESFLRMAHEYRTPENLLRTALIPAFKETLQATGSLMAAEEYYSGRRTEFNAEFENQMQMGIYLVSRQQVVVPDLTAQGDATAAANLGDKQQKYGEATKTKWNVKKKLDPDTGLSVRKAQKFTDYGIAVIEARVTDLVPNKKFVERMQLKQQASADRSIAQEKRIQEVEQKLLAVAKGEREVAEEQATAKKVQIKATTEAETEKQLALIKASKQLEQAEIDKQTAQITKEKADIDAVRIKTLADATAYEKEVVLQADNALAQKLETEVAIHKVWAAAYAKRAVPTNVFGGGSGDGGTPTGSDSETANFMKLMTLDAAKRLNYDRGIETTKQ